MAIFYGKSSSSQPSLSLLFAIEHILNIFLHVFRSLILRFYIYFTDSSKMHVTCTSNFTINRCQLSFRSPNHCLLISNWTLGSFTQTLNSGDGSPTIMPLNCQQQKLSNEYLKGSVCSGNGSRPLGSHP